MEDTNKTANRWTPLVVLLAWLSSRDRRPKASRKSFRQRFGDLLARFGLDF